MVAAPTSHSLRRELPQKAGSSAAHRGPGRTRPAVLLELLGPAPAYLPNEGDVREVEALPHRRGLLQVYPQRRVRVRLVIALVELPHRDCELRRRAGLGVRVGHQGARLEDHLPAVGEDSEGGRGARGWVGRGAGGGGGRSRYTSLLKLADGDAGRKVVGEFQRLEGWLEPFEKRRRRTRDGGRGGVGTVEGAGLFDAKCRQLVVVRGR
mmetsp:Transcript_2388/g.4422  ORF Transcript_2388/g.4422 Transcript_2388/m.4422 type:complete len:209 (+) Transcript_2388:407-1033(+)